MHSMSTMLALLATLASLAGCGTSSERPSRSLATQTTLEADQRAIALGKLRTYCKSCHAVGQLRFIQSEDDAQLWKYINETRAPGSNKLWAQAIVDVLSWPRGDTPPPFDEFKDPAKNQDWMPKGVKRLQLADDTVDGKSVRSIILDALRQEDH